MNKCQKCNGTGEITVPVEEHMGKVLYGKEQCDECGGTGEINPNEVDRFNAVDVIKVMEMVKEPMTNEEYIHSLNTEQLAEWIADKINDTVYSMSIDAWAGDVDRDEYWQRKSEWVEWLKQPHTAK